MLPISVGMSFLIIVVVALTTFGTRVVPFLLFPKGKTIPPIVMLVIYCLKSVSLMKNPHGLPELIACAMVVILHVWKRNNFLSIGVGTVLYMFLVQVVF